MKEKECLKCGFKSKRRKDFKKLSDGYYCPKCYQKKHKEHREFLKRKIGIKREKIKPKKSKFKLPKETLPKIKSIKPLKSKRPIMYLGLYEKQALFRMFRMRGLNYEESDKRVKEVVEQLKITREKLKQKYKSEKELNQKFLESYEELINE